MATILILYKTLSKAAKLHMVLFRKMDISGFFHRRDANGPFFCYEY